MLGGHVGSKILIWPIANRQFQALGSGFSQLGSWFRVQQGNDIEGGCNY